MKIILNHCTEGVIKNRLVRDQIYTTSIVANA